jgi:hypothetical protein
VEVNFLIKVYITSFKEFLDLRYKDLFVKANLKRGFHCVCVCVCVCVCGCVRARVRERAGESARVCVCVSE